MVFHWSLSDSKSPQVSRSLLSFLADLNNVAIWMVSTCHLISKSSNHFNNPSVTVPRTPIIIGIKVTFMLHSFFDYLARSRYWSFFSLSFNFTQWSVGKAKSTILQVLFFFVDNYYYFTLSEFSHQSSGWPSLESELYQVSLDLQDIFWILERKIFVVYLLKILYVN